MISIKSEREIELMREAGMMVSKTHKYLKDFTPKQAEKYAKSHKFRLF